MLSWIKALHKLTDGQVITMLEAALQAEVEAFLDEHQDRRDEQGRRLVVRNGHLPRREVLTGVITLDGQHVVGHLRYAAFS